MRVRRAAYRRLIRFARAEDGAAMVEFAIVAPVFFFFFFATIDFGLFTSSNLMAEKAVQIAARTAAMRPAACAGVPARHGVGTLTGQSFGTNCRNAANTCAAVAQVSCAGSAANATAAEIWARIAGTLPGGTAISDLTFTYTQDPALGYLGGPYTPMVTVDLRLSASPTLIPLGAIGGNFAPTTLNYRTISITVPGEDLALGTDG